MAYRRTSQPCFGMASYPSPSHHSPVSDSNLASSSNSTSSSTAFLAWASQPSPYQSMTPWVYYSSPSFPYFTSDMAAAAAATSHYSHSSYNYPPYSGPISSVPAPTIECIGPIVGSESPVSVATSIPAMLDNSNTSWHLKSTTDALAASDEPAQTQPKHKRPIKMEKQEQAARDIHDTLANTEPTVKANDVVNEDKAIQRVPCYRANPVTLGSLNIESISESKALFYFGILAIQTLSLPRFYFTKSQKSNKWDIKMTMYGMTFIRCHLYASRRAAKASICREALKKLKAEFPDWIVPERPKESSAPPGLDWITTLKEYCMHQGLPEPKYIKYVHPNGYRHEVEVSGGTYFGCLKYYADELPSQQGAAHVALYDVLVRDDEGRPEPKGLSSLKATNEHLLALVPRDPLHNHSPPESRVPARRRLEDRNVLWDPRKRQRIGKNRSPATFAQGFGNANLQPLKNCRLATIEAPVIAESRRWQVTPSDISRQLREIETWVGKLEKTCDLLALEHPEIRIERIDGRLIDTDGEYTAAAYFKTDPFLARAGAIGQIRGSFASINGAHEACACKTYDYLINMVKEDMALERKAAEEQKAITRWSETAS